MKYGVELVISAIIIIIVLFIIGYIIRKKHYREIDRLESQKLELMNRPVIDELAKVKQLNMTGETEVLFERWRHTWDEITTVHLPDIDEMLFDAEEFTDKFNFKRVKEVKLKIEKSIAQIDEQINTMLEELSELVGSEEKNREGIEEITKKYNAAKKQLIAERHTFDRAAKQLEKLLDEVNEGIRQYEELTNNGDYLKARETIAVLDEQAEQIIHKVEKLPNLLTECKTIIPSQIDELSQGYQEMKEQGYILDHIGMEQILEKIDKQLEAYNEYLSKAEVEEVESGMEDLKEKIDNLYDLLEKEVYAKHYVIQKNEEAEAIIEELRHANEDLQAETDLVQQSYHLLENDVEVPERLKFSLDDLRDRLQLLQAKILEEQSAFSILKVELNGIEKELEQLETDQNAFFEHLNSMRKDEMVARESITNLKKRINDIIRDVQKSHMPGVPADFESLYEQAAEQIEDVIRSLHEKPLNMKIVQKHLYEATDTVEHLSIRTDEHIENARLAEQVIQYGNRYRGRHEKLRNSLEQAEKAFRNYEYRAALEQAAAAVEEVEPGALKRIEEMYNEKIHV